jgi:hypothetical protein
MPVELIMLLYPGFSDFLDVIPSSTMPSDGTSTLMDEQGMGSVSPTPHGSL